eukprot:TRINITY_DN4127_c0_g1_i2.p1 TRINITY_DN4127_c0_g1~~TRINITY_DN4127_c0_g1_i2.p1  ORF type:complete len:307 (-),score=52.73 TRINITY_DN4127_c0_g1_i2:186-1106(-)
MSEVLRRNPHEPGAESLMDVELQVGGPAEPRPVVEEDLVPIFDEARAHKNVWKWLGLPIGISHVLTLFPEMIVYLGQNSEGVDNCDSYLWFTRIHLVLCFVIGVCFLDSRMAFNQYLHLLQLHEQERQVSWQANDEGDLEVIETGSEAALKIARHRYLRWLFLVPGSLLALSIFIIYSFFTPLPVFSSTCASRLSWSVTMRLVDMGVWAAGLLWLVLLCGCCWGCATRSNSSIHNLDIFQCCIPALLCCCFRMPSGRGYLPMHSEPAPISVCEQLTNCDNCECNECTRGGGGLADIDCTCSQERCC